jgi:hypothetical protein
VTWHPQLAVAGAPIWAVRAKPNDKPTALIAGCTSLGGKPWAVIAAFQDHRQRKLIAAADNCVVVAYAMSDLAILRSLGIAAVPGRSWNSLTKPQLDFLCATFQITSWSSPPKTLGTQHCNPPQSAETRELSLILANWSVAAFNAAHLDAAQTTWSHLAQLFRNLDLTNESFIGLCSPSADDLARLRDQLRYQDVSQIRAGLLTCLADNTKSLETELRPPSPPANTYVEAWREWQAAVANPRLAFGGQEACDRYRELVERQRFEPLHDQALRTVDPLERNLTFALVELSRLQHDEAQALSGKMYRNFRQGRAGSLNTEEDLGPLLALTDRALALTKGVLECRRYQSTLTLADRKPKAASSTPSASPPTESPRSASKVPSAKNGAAATR